jgi:DNA-binding SARP family transcriptional activator
MDFRILGPLEVVAEGRTCDLGGPKQRALLAMLLLDANRVVSSDRLIEALWDEDPPETASKALQVYVSQLRKALGRERLETRPPGYLLRVDEGELDLERFRLLRGEGRLSEALSLWRGPPLSDFRYERFAQSEIARLEEVRLTCLEDRLEADLAGGRHRDVVGELEGLVRQHPVRQGLRALLMLALYRSGRDADALQVYLDTRRVLDEELGIEPGRRLRDLQQAILRQEPGLDLVDEVQPAPAVERDDFVGRELELEQLRRGLDSALSGHGRVFLLAGEPGIGKSRLADELTARARTRGMHVLVGRCWEGGGAPVYWPWVQSLRAYVRETDAAVVRRELGPGACDLAQLLPELRELDPALPDPPALDPEAGRFRLFEAVTAVLKRAAERRPLVLVLDDLHAADDPSLLLLQFLAREIGDSRLLVLGAYRDVDPTIREPLSSALAELVREPVTRTLLLGGLGEADVARFIELTTSRLAPAAVVEALHAETEGNPLFVGEIVRLLAAEGGLEEPAPRLAVPQTLREVIARRLRRLSPPCEELLRVASVLGREFDLDVLADAGGLDRSSLLEILDEAVAAQLVTDVPGSRLRLRFGHGLFREVLYDELAVSRRRKLHRAVGEALERVSSGTVDTRLGELAHHFAGAVPLVNPGKAVDYAERAGDRAVRLLAPEEAVRLYETALSLVEDRERPRLLLRTARSMWMAGATGVERALAARDALVASVDHEGAAEAELLVANIHWYEGRRRLVSEDMQRALALVRGRPVGPTTAEVLELAARFHMLADETEDAVEVGREGLAIAEQLGLDSVRAHCLSDIGVARVCRGDLAGLEDVERALEIATAGQDGWAAWRARVNLADCLIWHVGDAARAFAERHEIRHLLSQAGSWPITRWNLAYDAAEAFWLGHWAEAARLCDDFIAQVEGGNPHNIASELYTLRARMGAARGDERALVDASAAVTLGRRAGDSRNLYPAIAFNAEIAAELGELEEAGRLVDELVSAQGPEPFPNYLAPLAIAALVLGRSAEVVGRLERLRPSPWRDAALALLHGDWVDAARRFERIGVLPEAAQARLLAAEAFASSDRADESEAFLAGCLPFFEAVGATAHLERARLAQDRRAGTRPPRRS